MNTEARDRYSSVRIDAVHYCELEEILSEKRSRKTFLKSTAEVADIPAVRLSLFCRTVRESQVWANKVELLKLPYMTRETCKGDMARTVSALPNLRYVDLPDGVYTGEGSCYTLVTELQARCPDIRKMTYRSGAEPSLELLTRRNWQALEVLELSAIAVEPSTLRLVLAALPTLHHLTMSDMAWLDDSIFQSSPTLPEFPPLQSLTLENVHRITAEGLKQYLSHPQNREVLSSLSLSSTGVEIQDIHTFLWGAPNLTVLSINETVSRSLGLGLNNTPPFTSISLKTLHFEISDSENAVGLQRPAESYYSYLASCLFSNALPALTRLYVRDPSFPELLVLPPPGLKGNNAKGPNQARFNHALEVYAKGMDELDWVFTSIAPPTGLNAGSPVTAGRPLSSYSASRGLGPQWSQGGFGGEARKSVMVGNGFGGFLAVPQDETPRPRTSSGVTGSDRASPSLGTGGGSQQGSLGSSFGSRTSWLKPASFTGSMGSVGSRIDNRKSRQDLWR